MSEGVAVYDTGMLIALVAQKAKAVQIHQRIKGKAVHRPVVPGLVLAQVWRPTPRLAHALGVLLKDCTVPHARSSQAAFRPVDGVRSLCMACSTSPDIKDLRRIGTALGTADLPAKKRPDAVDATVAWTAMLHTKAVVFTSDPHDMTAYLTAFHASATDVVAV